MQGARGAGTVASYPSAPLPLLLSSNDNNSPQSRRAYTMHLVEGAPGSTWRADNWLQRRPDLPFQPLFDETGEVAAAGAG